jgi:hypothetical protein
MVNSARKKKNTGKRTDDNEDVPEEPASSSLVHEISDGRVDRPAIKKNKCVGIEERRKKSDPRPCQNATCKALIEAIRNFNRREQYTNRGKGNVGRTHCCRDVGEALLHEQMNGSLGQGVSAQQGAHDIPDLGIPLAPTEDRIDAFRERAHAESEYAQRPPQEIGRSAL